MTAPSGSPLAPARRRRVPPWVWWLAGAFVVLVVVVLFLGRPEPRPFPLSPTSEYPDGTKGLVMLLEAQGAEVDVTDDAPSSPGELDGVDVVYLPVDYLYELEEISALEQWVEAGGRLVVADPVSQFTSLVSAEGVSPVDPIPAGRCTIDALSGLDSVVPGPAASLYDTPVLEGTCFTAEGGAFVTASDAGEGTLVSLGGAYVFANDLLDDADNAGLAVALLAPEAGTRVRYLDLDLTLPPPEDVDRPEAPNPLSGVIDMLPDAAVPAVSQLVLAFLAYAVWRGRRVGRPVTEPQAVTVEGSELVGAVGRLLERSRNPERAAHVLRADLRHALADQVGLPRDTSDEVLVAVVSERTGADPARLTSALSPVPLDPDASLADLARYVESVRQEVLHGTGP